MGKCNSLVYVHFGGVIQWLDITLMTSALLIAVGMVFVYGVVIMMHLNAILQVSAESASISMILTTVQTVTLSTPIAIYLNVKRGVKMAKGGYFVIAYPDDRRGFDIDTWVNFIQSKGGEVAYILHDKDDCKPHYHILNCWRKGFPDWDEFRSWMMVYHVLSPDPKHRGKSKLENQYCQSVAIMRDVDACLDYMIHE